MRTSEIGIKLIHSFESFRNKAYKDSVGVWTIGWGSTRIHGRPVKRGDYVTRGQADEQFKADLKLFESYVKEYVEVPLNQNQFDALVSITYNMGQGNLKKSTLLKLLNRKEYESAGEAFMLYVKGRNRKTGKVKTIKGLVRRRKAEKELFLTPECGHNLYLLVDNLKPRGLDNLRIAWEKRKYEMAS